VREKVTRWRQSGVWARVLAALGCGLMAGVFFAFSAFVMKALARLPAMPCIAAMQSINVAAVTRSFMAAFLGTAAASAIMIVSSLLQWQDSGATFRLIGGVLYLVGSFLVTMVFNVPRNNVHASVAPNDPDGASSWAGYVASWTAWNHVRTVAALAGSASLMIALVVA
jgi:uncharacterized membrane protein